MKEPVEAEIIECGEIKIAASYVTRSQKEHPAYVSSAILTYARKGQLHVRTENQLYTIPRGSFVLVRKYTTAHYSKTFTAAEGEAKAYSFILNDKVIRKVI